MPVILLVENKDADVLLFHRALKRLLFEGTVHVAPSINVAQEYMEGRGDYADRSYYRIPNLIVAEIDLPGESGTVLWEWLRQRPQYSHIPFVFFSSTLAPERLWSRPGGVQPHHFAKTADVVEFKNRVEAILKLLPKAGNSPGSPKLR